MTDTEMLDWQERNAGLLKCYTRGWWSIRLQQYFPTLREAILAENGIEKEGDEKCTTQSPVTASNAENVEVDCKAVEVTKTADLTQLEDSLAKLNQAVMPGEIEKIIQQLTGERDEAVDKEQARWQEAIYTLLCKHCPEANIDGKGCDSGHPLDFTISEIAQGLCHLKDKIDQLTADLATSQARVEVLEDILKQALLTFRHDHWDKTMQHGRGCLICIEQKRVREKAQQALAGKGDV